MVTRQSADYHRAAAKEAATLYKSGLTPVSASLDWSEANLQAQAMIRRLLEASNALRDVAGALTKTGSHQLVLRFMLAPPQSQDQFALICEEYSKGAEKSGRELSFAQSLAVASRFDVWRDKTLTSWLDRKSDPTDREINALVSSVAPIISMQFVSTARRSRLSSQQEGAIVDLLKKKGWVRKDVGIVQTQSDLRAKEFTHKTRFATTTQPQEVDIACGLGKGVILAMECKVTNDHTNSVKRINDVLKKARAWQQHWGSFIKTAALLQGVIKADDVNRLLAENVEVFWSHKLDDFEQWLDFNVTG
jgi:hypothetical protein